MRRGHTKPPTNTYMRATSEGEKKRHIMASDFFESVCAVNGKCYNYYFTMTIQSDTLSNVGLE